MNRVLGRSVTGTLDVSDIEWWPLASNVVEAGVIGGELQAVCPVTEQPDIYEFEFTFTGRYEPESKALKMYLLSFRDVPISCADLAATIAHDLTSGAGAPVTVRLMQNTRGGMRLSATAVGDTR